MTLETSKLQFNSDITNETNFVFYNATIIIDSNTVIEKSALVIKDNLVLDYGISSDICKTYKNFKQIDCDNYTISPGFINSHTHVAMGFFRDLSHQKKNMIEKLFFPIESSLNASLTASLAYSYIVAGIKSGTTTFNEHYYFAKELGGVFESLGVRAFIGETIADKGAAFPSSAVAKWKEWQNNITGWQFSDLIKPVIAPHASDTVSPKLLKEMAKYAQTNNLPIHMHLSQTKNEFNYIQKTYNKTPVEFAQNCNLLTERTFVTHLVSAINSDMKIIKDSGATFAYCPASEIIYEQLPPILDIFTQEIPYALGTDCAASCDGANLFAEMRLAYLLAKDRQIAEQFCNAKKVFDAVTVNAAKILAPGKLGALIKGSYADVIFLQNALDTLPIHDQLANIIFSRNPTHVKHVLINGKFVFLNQKIITRNEDNLKNIYLEAVNEINQKLT